MKKKNDDHASVSAAFGTIRISPNPLCSLVQKVNREPVSLITSHAAIPVAKIPLCVASAIYLVSSCPFISRLFPLIDFAKSQPVVTTLKWGACHAASRTVFSLSTGEYPQIPTQVRPR